MLDVNPEKALIQSLLNGGDIARVRQIVPESSYFASAGEATCYDGILTLAAEGKPIESLLLTKIIDMSDHVTRVAWTDAQSIDYPADYAVFYAEEVAAGYERREMIQSAQKLSEQLESGEGTADDFTNEAQRVSSLRPKAKDTLITAKEATRRAIERMEERFEARRKGQTMFGIPFGIPVLDSYIGGMRKGQLVIVGARPSVGKTSLGIAFANEAAINHEASCLFASLEMTAEDQADRLLSLRSGVPHREIYLGELTSGNAPKIMRAAGELDNSRLIFQARPGLTVPQLCADVHRMVRDGLELLIIDYLGLLKYPQFSSSDSSYKEISEISNALKELALSAEIPIVALCQLNRGNAKAQREPRMSDLRDSGAIEQDADIIVMLHRSGKQREEWSNEDIEPAKLIIEKNRNGPTGATPLKFHKPTMTFTQWDRDDFPTEFD